MKTYASGTDSLKKQDSLLTARTPGFPMPQPPQRSSLEQAINQENGLISDLDREARKLLVEIHKKYAIPVACIVFIFIGVPLGIMARKGTFGMAASLSLGFFLLYWSCLIGGEKLADRGVIEPWLGMWIANILIGIFGLYLTVRSARENLSIDWSIFTRFLPKFWRMEEETGQA